jgi:hypothetical protein
MISINPVKLNAAFSVRDNLDPEANVIEESNLHKEKHASPKTSTDAGRMISTKSFRKNAYFSIRDNFNSDSNVTEESDLHS